MADSPDPISSSEHGPADIDPNGLSEYELLLRCAQQDSKRRDRAQSWQPDLNIADWRFDDQANVAPWEAFQGGILTDRDSNRDSSTPGDASVLQTFSQHAELALRPKKKMQTGCIPCLIKGIQCDPRNAGCKLAMSDEWRLNTQDDTPGPISPGTAYSDDEQTSLTLFRPDVKWRRNWRERHSLNFFATYSAPQMAGFFDSSFWRRMVIQTSFAEPAISHIVTGIGSLHEAILQRAFLDERRRAQATEFALDQCNKAISCLTASSFNTVRPRNLRLALITCVLFTCFEAMQGRCDSAVSHALQGRRLLEAADRATATELTPQEISEIEQMRPLVERLDVQATALLDKGKRSAGTLMPQAETLPLIETIHSLDHAHNILHVAMNNVMRFMQHFKPDAPRAEIEAFVAHKNAKYVPWFQQWELAFTAFLSAQTSPLVAMDVKKAMVLKANQLVGTMLASVDQSAGPMAYDTYETEFRAIVDLAREILAAYSCPPLPSLSHAQSTAPYLSFSLWITDPLWLTISRCRTASVRQVAFTLLSQNPRQEGIWHAGPLLSYNRYPRKTEAHDTATSPEEASPRPIAAAKSSARRGKITDKICGPWTTMLARVEQRARDPENKGRNVNVRYSTYCTGRCAIPTIGELEHMKAYR